MSVTRLMVQVRKTGVGWQLRSPRHLRMSAHLFSSARLEVDGVVVARVKLPLSPRGQIGEYLRNDPVMGPLLGVFDVAG